MNPKESHLVVVKGILKYLKGTEDLCLYYPYEYPFDLVGYIDADYAQCTIDRKTTSGMAQFIGPCLVSWESKKQYIVVLSTTEANTLLQPHVVLISFGLSSRLVTMDSSINQNLSCVTTLVLSI